MNEVTDEIKTLDEALARIEALEAQNSRLLFVLRERKLAGYIGDSSNLTPVYYISDEYDAAGFLITPEVKIEQ